ncbi:MAG: molybdopterin-dependent oxidoreductase [Dehalococcoidales bacterium]|nr:molybdopterin-dependent oxidoreductase [Dehalococcoidales bacterium]
MEAITITLNGVEVSGYPGMTILELARESGVEIPTLCHDSHLTPTGACRICLVEEEHSAALLPSCITKIQPGMVVHTHSSRVQEHRKVILELMLSTHPDSCMVCDKGNRCELRKLAAEMGIGLVDLKKIPQPGVIQEVNPFIERDLSRCILCAKCIRADQELVVAGAIDYKDRGFATRPATLNDVALEKSECTFCGVCVALCPTGALMEKDQTLRGTSNDLVDSVCPFCGCGCPIQLEIKNGRIVRVRPDTESRAGNGALCVRASYGYDFVHSPERLTVPLLKVNGNFEKITWEKALDFIAAEFTRIKEGSGADSLAVFGSSKCTNEDNYLLQRFTRSVLGTNNIDNGSRLYASPGRVALGWSIGFAGTTGSINGLEQSQVILVIGANPSASAPVLEYALKRATKFKGASLLLINPLWTKLVPFARLWLRPEIGTDVALLNALAKVIIDEKLYDEEYVIRKTENFAALTSNLKNYSINHAVNITGVSAGDIEKAAHIIAGAERVSIVYGNGVTQQINGADNVLALANLAMLTGNISQSGGGILAIQRENNAQGACDMGSLPDFLPGYCEVDDGRARKNFEERWGAPLPVKRGLTGLEMFKEMESGKIKGMFIMGENPVASFPAPDSVKRAISSLGFLAVADLFLTETARLANVVLPCAGFAEKEGTFTNFEGRVQWLNKAIDPPGDSLPEWEIIGKLAERMGHPMAYSTTREITDEIEESVPFYQHSNDSDIEIEEYVSNKTNDRPLSKRRLYKGAFPSGFERFSPVNFIPSEKTGNGEYPYSLLAGSVLGHFGSGTRSNRASKLHKFLPNAWLEVSQDDAKTLNLVEGDKIKVISAACEVTTPVRISNTLFPGMLFMPISFPDTPVNSLFGFVLDSRAKSPPMKSCRVRLEKVK